MNGKTLKIIIVTYGNEITVFRQITSVIKVKYNIQKDTKWQSVCLASLNMFEPKLSKWLSIYWVLVIFNLPQRKNMSCTNYWPPNPRKFILHAWKDLLIFAELTHHLFIAPYDRIQRRTKVSIWKPLWPLKRFEAMLSNLPFMLYMLYPSDDFRSLPLNTCLANSIFRKHFAKYTLVTIRKRPKHNHVQNGGT